MKSGKEVGNQANVQATQTSYGRRRQATQILNLKQKLAKLQATARQLQRQPAIANKQLCCSRSHGLLRLGPSLCAWAKELLSGTLPRASSLFVNTNTEALPSSVIEFSGRSKYQGPQRPQIVELLFLRTPTKGSAMYRNSLILTGSLWACTCYDGLAQTFFRLVTQRAPMRLEAILCNIAAPASTTHQQAFRPKRHLIRGHMTPEGM